MNCRSEVLEVSVEGRQVEEAMLAVLHTVLLHRSTGKFHYKKEGTYSIGTVGIQDVDCDFIDFTYVRVSSEELDRALRKVVGEFKARYLLQGLHSQVDARSPGLQRSHLISDLVSSGRVRCEVP
ncbi:Autophagy-related protein 101 [Microtus ochrogaster]|uniref:Autophagy-related protein 101 n=1 Tax=Microtus ochrogaster TaxID=79684 RepID=A0A8J6GQE7_MICOH|nr:Autophagy-related protein 101 [Microtus ochrogaster]